MMALTTRRAFISGAVALITAPAIVRVESLMPIKALKDFTIWGVDWPYEVIYTQAILDDLLAKIIYPPLIVDNTGAIDTVASKTMHEQTIATFKFLKEQIDGQ